MTTIMELNTFLQGNPAGPVPAVTRAEILKLLSECWTAFAGSTHTKMQYYKVVRDGGPMSMEWDSPVLTLVVARHPTTGRGSGRVYKQQWELNLENQAADCRTVGYLQSRPRDRDLKVDLIAKQVCDAVLLGPRSGSDFVSECSLVWKDGYVVVRQSKLITGRFASTIQSRRKRFRNELIPLMAAIGWELVKARPSLTFQRREASQNF